MLHKIENSEHFRKLRKDKNLTQQEFAEKLGITLRMVQLLEKGDRAITENTQLRIDRYLKSEQSTGREPVIMKLEIPDEPYISKRRDKKLNETTNKIPFYDAEASAGNTESDMSPVAGPSGTIDIGDLLRDSKAALRIYGNSMLPNYPPGCVLGLTPVETNFIEPGEVYVIETRDRRIFKRLFYKDDDADSNYLTCYSDNIMVFEGGSRNGKSAYPPFNIPKSDIIRLFVVTGVIKRNSNSVIFNK